LCVEAAEGRVVVAGSEVEEAEVRVVLLAGVAVVAFRGSRGFEGLAEGVVEAGVGDGFAWVRQGHDAAVAVAVAAWHAARSREQRAPEPARLLEAAAATSPDDSAVGRGLRRAAEMPGDADLGQAVRALGNGSRVSCPDTVPLALWIAAAHLDDYEGAVQRAVAAGGDTDTVAAIAGGVVASRVSTAGIPAAWLEATEALALRPAL